MEKKKKPSELEKFLTKKVFNKKAETGAAAALSIGDLIYDTARIDPIYVKGAQFSRPEAVDISSKFKIGKQNIKDMEAVRPGKPLQGEDYSEYLHEVNYRGGVQEFLTDRWVLENATDRWMLENNVEIQIPKKMNQPGWDRIYNGEKWQIKGGSVADVREARTESEYRVATTTETAAAYKEQYPEDADAVLGTYSKSVTDKILEEGKEASMEIYEDNEFFNSVVPEFLAIPSLVSSIKNVSNYSKDKINAETAIQNVAIDSVGKGGAMLAGGAIGSIFGPLGTLVGGAAGLFIAKDHIDDFKLNTFAKKEIEKLKRDLDNYIIAAIKIIKKNLKVFKRKKKKMESYSGDSTFAKIYQFFRVKILKKRKQKTVPKGLINYLSERMEKEYKEKKKILQKLIRSTEEKEDDKDKDSDVKLRYAYLKLGTLKDASLSKLPLCCQTAIEVCADVGILPIFLEKEYKQLKKSSEQFIKAAEKRGV